jgi:acetylornithine deacetylase/succinyl-diaminopimelate desuccinylase-like protein
VTFGPGNVEECHCPVERVSLDEMGIASRVIARVARELLL